LEPIWACKLSGNTFSRTASLIPTSHDQSIQTGLSLLSTNFIQDALKVL
jgi:hypothetical protein